MRWPPQRQTARSVQECERHRSQPAAHAPPRREGEGARNVASKRGRSPLPGEREGLFGTSGAGRSPNPGHEAGPRRSHVCDPVNKPHAGLCLTLRVSSHSTSPVNTVGGLELVPLSRRLHETSCVQLLQVRGERPHEEAGLAGPRGRRLEQGQGSASRLHKQKGEVTPLPRVLLLQWGTHHLQAAFPGARRPERGLPHPLCRDVGSGVVSQQGQAWLTRGLPSSPFFKCPFPRRRSTGQGRWRDTAT